MTRTKRFLVRLMSLMICISIITVNASAAFVNETAFDSMYDLEQTELLTSVFDEMSAEAQEIFLNYMQASDPVLLQYHKKHVDLISSPLSRHLK